MNSTNATNFRQFDLLIFNEIIASKPLTNISIAFVTFLVVLYVTLIIWAVLRDKKPLGPDSRVRGIQTISNTFVPDDFNITNETISHNPTSEDSDRIPENFVNAPVDNMKLGSQKPNNSPFFSLGDDEIPHALEMEADSKENENKDALKLETTMMSMLPRKIPQQNEKPSTVNLEFPEKEASPHPGEEEKTSKRTSTRRKRPKEKTLDSVLIKKRETVMSKFSKLFTQKNPIFSTIYVTSKISPRYKRVTLIFFAILADLLLNSFILFDEMRFKGPFYPFAFGLLVWGFFNLIVFLSSVSKEALKNSHTYQEFQIAIREVEREALLKNIAIHVLVGLFAMLAFSQILLFVTLYDDNWDKVTSWIFYSVMAIIFQFGVVDVVWILLLAFIYCRAYDSRTLKRVYRFLNRCKMWRV